MKIFIDFDDVVFNARDFKEGLIKVFLKNGVSRHEFENSYYTFQKRAQEWGEDYNPKKQIEVLRKRNRINRAKLNRDLDKFMENLGQYVFSDTLDFLRQFSKKDRYLITYGHIKFQMKKIFNSGITNYFDKDKIIFTKGDKIDKIMEISQKHKFPAREKVILIDDRPEQLERTEREKKSIITFRMCRPEGRYSDLICMEKDYEVKSLKEAGKIIHEF